MVVVKLLLPDGELVVEPSSISIPTPGGLNEQLQHVSQACQFTTPSEPEIFAAAVTYDVIDALVEDDGKTLFTGKIKTDTSWTDNGFPTPIETMSFSIFDNTELLNIKTKKEIALTNTNLAQIVETICGECSLAISEPEKLPQETFVKAFVLDEGTNLLQALNNVLFQHGFFFGFDENGKIYVTQIHLEGKPNSTLTEETFYTGLKLKRTSTKNDSVKVSFTPLVERENEQVFFEGNDLNENNTITPITIRPGQYYPYESDPIQEQREGKVWQTFASGYAEVFTKYNGETAYRRSEKTSLLYTKNHYVVQDWEGNVVIDREEFGARRSAVRLQNKGDQDANLFQLAIRATACYREAESSVTVGNGETPYEYAADYLYTAADAEALASSLSRFFTGTNFSITGTTAQALLPGSCYAIDSGASAFTGTAVCLSSEFEPETQKYSVKLITYSLASVDVERYRAVAGSGNSLNNKIADIQTGLNEIFSGEGEKIGTPDIPRGVKAEAAMDGIRVSWLNPNPGLKNIIKEYQVELSRGYEFAEKWTTTATETDYKFYRPTDGYPEATDLDKWKVRVKAVNIYGKESGWSSEVTPNTDTYGTWILTQPKVIVTVQDRHISLAFSQPSRADGRLVYGDVRYGVLVRRPDIDVDEDVWFTPGTSLNPYPEKLADGTKASNELNYRLETHEPEIRTETFTQTMPLIGQGGDGRSIQNTLYLFKVVAESEAGISPPATAQATALCTNIVDLVNANMTQKEAYVPDLSAISANLGSINQGGMGSGNNRWDLTTFVDRSGTQRLEGLFRVGNNRQHFRVTPILNDIGQIVDYDIVFKVNNILFSSTANRIDGEIIVMLEDKPWERTRITPAGTYYEFKPSEEAGWQTVAQQEARGLMSQIVYSQASIVLTNSSITQRRRNGVDLGRPYLSDNSKVYHFDTDFFDQHGSQGYVLEGQAQLVDGSNNTPLSPIDFTAAILSVAPYSEIGKSAYGQFSLVHPLGNSNVFTVDFWVQYIWAENQVLLDIGIPSDRIQLICSSGEPNYNEPQEDEPPYNWEIDTADQMPYNVAAGASVYVNHQGRVLSEIIQLKDIGFEFVPNTWEHLAVVLTETEIILYIRDREIHFSRNETGIQEATAVINEGCMSFQLDELIVDTTCVRGFEDFVEGTHDKVPWGSLDHKKSHFVIEADDPDNFAGNFFTSTAFENAVQRIIDKNKQEEQ